MITGVFEAQNKLYRSGSGGRKIKRMVEWPTPTNVKKVRGFLGLTGYYKRFVKGFMPGQLHFT